jgi:3-isopropylmalate dehydrogenase
VTLRSFRICLLPGDGIGPEITTEAVKVMRAIGDASGVVFDFHESLLGGIAIDETGSPLPAGTLAEAHAADAVLLAAIGGPKWDTTDPAKPRPEQGLLGMRKELGLYANLRPVKIFAPLADASSLKSEALDGVDMLIVRELTGGLYFGVSGRESDAPGAATGGGAGRRAFDTMEYREYEIERIARTAFMAARGRGRKDRKSVV